jgi:hypothetical protein
MGPLSVEPPRASPARITQDLTSVECPQTLEIGQAFGDGFDVTVGDCKKEKSML